MPSISALTWRYTKSSHASRRVCAVHDPAACAVSRSRAAFTYRGNLHGAARLNTGLLALGTRPRKLMGTTGAAMLLIRPLLRANDNRRHRAHVVIFFIFLVANVGGALTPLGDPPLFLGFLKGVTSSGPQSMLWPTLTASVILLCVFYFLDRWLYRRAGEVQPEDPTPPLPLSIDGKVNFILLGAVIVCVLASGVWRPNVSATVLGSTLELQNVCRDVALLAIAWASWKWTPSSVRRSSPFHLGTDRRSRQALRWYFPYDHPRNCHASCR